MNRVKRTKSYRWPIIILIIIFITIGSILIYRTHKNNTTKKVANISTASHSTPTTKQDTGTLSTPIVSQPVQSSPTAPPESPSGSFVSSYQITQNGQETSYCNSTPGANCIITFTSNGVSKSLASTAVATSGKNDQVAFASWTWHPSDIGLTPGSWGVSATATLNGQSVTTQSTYQLVVSP
jgi:hypothetical protein